MINVILVEDIVTGRTLLGMLTPSSNTILEPLTSEILSGTPDITAHFSRFRVTEISMNPTALGQFDTGAQLAAAGLLADAKVDAIAWGGTSGGWVGIEADRQLCGAIERTTGRPATTSTLSLLEAFKVLGVENYGLVTPYLTDVQNKIQENFRKEGFNCISETHLNNKDNFSFSESDEITIENMVRDVARNSPDAIAIYCTNFNGTRIAPKLEMELGIPVLDSVSFTLWRTIQLAGADTKRIIGWGGLFRRGQ
ncbi:MAG: maleate cis-trans isomerase family protein [Paracoccaceae bacterium]